MNRENNYKFSMFNLYITINHDELGIYNTLHDSAVLLNNKIFEKLPNGIKNSLEISQLLNEKIIWKNDFDEKQYFRYYINKLKYSPKDASFIIMVTSDCNLACKYCFEGIEKKPLYMSEKTADSVVSFIERTIERNLSLRNVQITFYGGEPLLNERAIMQICNSISKRKNIEKYVNYSITTNLSLLKYMDINLFRKFKFNSVQVALDGPPEMHNSRRCTKSGSPTYRTIIENIKLLINATIPVIVIINYDGENYSSIDEMISIIKKELPYEKILFFLNPIIKSLMNANCKTLYLSDERESELYIRFYKTLRENNIPIQSIGQRDMVCSATTDVSCTIDPMGNIYKCALTMNNERYIVGCVSDDVLNNLYYKLILDEPWGNCLANCCEYLPLCGGGCRAFALLSNNSLSDLFCQKKEYYKRIYEYTLYDHFLYLMKGNHVI